MSEQASSSGDAGCAVVLVALILSIAGSCAYIHHDEASTQRASIAAGGEMFGGHCDATKRAKETRVE